VLGRWISEDPIGVAGGLNLYGYVGNDPVNGSDPYGLGDGDPCDSDGDGEFDGVKVGDRCVAGSGFVLPEITVVAQGPTDETITFQVGMWNPASYSATGPAYQPFKTNSSAMVRFQMTLRTTNGALKGCREPYPKYYDPQAKVTMIDAVTGAPLGTQIQRVDFDLRRKKTKRGYGPTRVDGYGGSVTVQGRLFGVQGEVHCSAATGTFWTNPTLF
jgi:hypothetical protein